VRLRVKLLGTGASAIENTTGLVPERRSQDVLKIVVVPLEEIEYLVTKAQEAGAKG
jgi:hypothetical protein